MSLQAISRAGKVLVNTASVIEARLVVHGRRGQRGVALLDDFLRSPRSLRGVAHEKDEANAAYLAFVLYGRNNGHPAA